MSFVAVLLPLLFAQDSLRNAPEATKADLAELKDLILLDLKDPKSVTHANGLPDRWRVRRSLELACGWTDPDFVPPLLALLDGVPEHRIQAAGCLIRYQKPDLDRRVAAHSKHHQDLAGGCLSYPLSIQELTENYKRTGAVDSMLRAADVESNLITLQNGDPQSKMKAWIVLAEHAWFAPWQEYGLNATEVWYACKKSDAERALSRPILGAERAKQLLALGATDGDTGAPGDRRHHRKPLGIGVRRGRAGVPGHPEVHRHDICGTTGTRPTRPTHRSTPSAGILTRPISISSGV